MRVAVRRYRACTTEYLPTTVWRTKRWDLKPCPSQSNPFLRRASAGRWAVPSPRCWSAPSLVLGSATAVRAADDDEAEDTVDTKFMLNFLTNLGLRQGNEPGIDYHERSPLVVPPTRDLPKPETNSAAVANPAWPKDPDVQRQKKVKRAAQEHRRGRGRRHASASA